MPTYVASDIAPLRRVLVHPPGPETRAVLSLCAGDHPFLAADLLWDRAPAEHAALVEILQAHAVEVVLLETMLDEALQAARDVGDGDTWLTTHLPHLRGHESAVTGQVLLGATAAFVYPPHASGTFAPLVEPLKWMIFPRDIAVMTPRGIILGQFANRSRARERDLLAFALRYAPGLRDYPLLFDAAEEGVFLQGGDVLVLDDHTLLVGIGNRSEERAAVRLAQRLAMDVLAVALPGPFSIPEPRSSSGHRLSSLFLHLDTVCTWVDTATILAVPYFLETTATTNPLLPIIQHLVTTAAVTRDDARAMMDALHHMGSVTLFRAGSGERDPVYAGMKLLDVLRAQGVRVVPVGGDRHDGNEAKYLIEQVLRETHFQAANTLALQPGHVIAYAGNHATRLALAHAGVTVTTFEAPDLVRWHGGPHCLTLPLARG